MCLLRSRHKLHNTTTSLQVEHSVHAEKQRQSPNKACVMINAQYGLPSHRDPAELFSEDLSPLIPDWANRTKVGANELAPFRAASEFSY